jgi:hypothetical protein
VPEQQKKLSLKSKMNKNLTKRHLTVLWALNQPCYFVSFFALFVTCFIHNVGATVSYEPLDIRTAISHLKLFEELVFNESDRRDILQTPTRPRSPLFDGEGN